MNLTRGLLRSWDFSAAVRACSPGWCTRLVWGASGPGNVQIVRHADESRNATGYTGVALNPRHPSDLPSPVVPPKAYAPPADVPSGAAMRRVLRRARDGVALNVGEAAIALAARGPDLV